jgi:hypothetical protein
VARVCVGAGRGGRPAEGDISALGAGSTVRAPAGYASRREQRLAADESRHLCALQYRLELGFVDDRDALAIQDAMTRIDQFYAGF